MAEPGRAPERRTPRPPLPATVGWSAAERLAVPRAWDTWALANAESQYAGMLNATVEG